MKQLRTLTIALALAFPFVSFAQSVEIEVSLEDFDFESALSCNQSLLACQLERETTKRLVEELLRQILEAQLVEQMTEGDGYWTEESYRESLEETPLDEGRTRMFDVDDGEIKGFDEEHPVYREVWRMFSALVPEEYLELFDSLEFYNNESDQYAALVYQRIRTSGGEESEEWELRINLANVSFASDYRYNLALETIAHEAGHVLLTNNDELEFFTEEEECGSFYVAQLRSCAEQGSYYDTFTEFWDEDFLEWGEYFIEAIREDQQEALEELEEYYEDRQDEFVSEYAASSPHEDLAETMVEYARYDLPTGELTLAEEKVVALYEFDDMQIYRQALQNLLRK